MLPRKGRTTPAEKSTDSLTFLSPHETVKEEDRLQQSFLLRQRRETRRRFRAGVTAVVAAYRLRKLLALRGVNNPLWRLERITNAQRGALLPRRRAPRSANPREMHAARTAMSASISTPDGLRFTMARGGGRSWSPPHGTMFVAFLAGIVTPDGTALYALLALRPPPSLVLASSSSALLSSSTGGGSTLVAHEFWLAFDAALRETKPPPVVEICTLSNAFIPDVLGCIVGTTRLVPCRDVHFDSRYVQLEAYLPASTITRLSTPDDSNRILGQLALCVSLGNGSAIPLGTRRLHPDLGAVYSVLHSVSRLIRQEEEEGPVRLFADHNAAVEGVEDDGIIMHLLATSTEEPMTGEGPAMGVVSAHIKSLSVAFLSRVFLPIVVLRLRRRSRQRLRQQFASHITTSLTAATLAKSVPAIQDWPSSVLQRLAGAAVSHVAVSGEALVYRGTPSTTGIIIVAAGFANIESCERLAPRRHQQQQPPRSVSAVSFTFPTPTSQRLGSPDPEDFDITIGSNSAVAAAIQAHAASPTVTVRGTPTPAPSSRFVVTASLGPLSSARGFDVLNDGSALCTIRATTAPHAAVIPYIDVNDETFIVQGPRATNCSVPPPPRQPAHTHSRLETSLRHALGSGSPPQHSFACGVLPSLIDATAQQQPQLLPVTLYWTIPRALIDAVLVLSIASNTTTRKVSPVGGAADALPPLTRQRTVIAAFEVRTAEVPLRNPLMPALLRQHLPSFANCSMLALERLAAVAKPLSLPRGASVFERGAHANTVYVLCVGRCGVFRSLGGSHTIANAVIPGITHQLTLLPPPASVVQGGQHVETRYPLCDLGLEPVLFSGPYTHSVCTLSHCDFYTFTRDDLGSVFMARGGKASVGGGVALPASLLLHPGPSTPAKEAKEASGKAPPTKVELDARDSSNGQVSDDELDRTLGADSVSELLVPSISSYTPRASFLSSTPAAAAAPTSPAATTAAGAAANAVIKADALREEWLTLTSRAEQANRRHMSQAQSRCLPLLEDIPFIGTYLRDHPDDATAFLGAFTPRQYQPGQCIASCSGYADRIVILVEGTVTITLSHQHNMDNCSDSRSVAARLRKALEEHRHQLIQGASSPIHALDCFAPGESIGATCVISHRWTGSVIARSVARVVELSRDRYLAALHRMGQYERVRRCVLALLFPNACSDAEILMEAARSIQHLRSPILFPISGSYRVAVDEYGYGVQPTKASVEEPGKDKDSKQRDLTRESIRTRLLLQSASRASRPHMAALLTRDLESTVDVVARSLVGGGAMAPPPPSSSLLAVSRWSRGRSLVITPPLLNPGTAAHRDTPVTRRDRHTATHQYR